jgi:hypothetical protein
LKDRERSVTKFDRVPASAAGMQARDRLQLPFGGPSRLRAREGSGADFLHPAAEMEIHSL